MTYRARLVAAFVLITLGMCCCRPQAPTATPPRATATALPSPTRQPTSTRVSATPTSSPSATADSTAFPTSSPAASPTAQPRIILTEINAQANVPGVLHVMGRAQVFEATVSLRVKGEDGQVIVQGVTMASRGAPEWGEFSVDVLYKPPAVDQVGVLEVYEESPRDGSPQNLVSASVALRSAPELSRWRTFISPEYHFQMLFPLDWQLNQGEFFPPPPKTIKFSTYSGNEMQTLGTQDAEVWVTFSEAASIAEMEDLQRKGYLKRNLILGGRAAVRYTDANPHHGVYDVVYTLTGPGEYRIHLSAATRDFDALFSLMLSSFSG